MVAHAARIFAAIYGVEARHGGPESHQIQNPTKESPCGKATICGPERATVWRLLSSGPVPGAGGGDKLSEKAPG